MRMVLLVGLGGGLGSMARYLVGTWVQARNSGTFPVGTLIVNVTGALLLGILARSLDPESHQLRALFMIGLCGGYTTFSAFSLETAALLEHGDWAPALGYVTASVVGSVLAVFVGFRLVAMMIGNPA